jgi:hypothetical protein
MAKNNNAFGLSTLNILAIVLVLVIIPFATAIIQNPTGSNEYDDWENVLSEGGVSLGTPEFENWSSLQYSYWYDNGNVNATQWYRDDNVGLPEDEFRCKYIDDGECSNFTTAPLNGFQFGTKTFQNGNNRVYQEFHQTHGYLAPTTTSSVSNYYGYSGNKDFKIRFWGETLRSLDDGELIDSFKITFVDRAVLHNCGSATIHKLNIDYSIQFEKWDGSSWVKNEEINYKVQVDSMFEEYFYHSGSLTSYCFTGFSLVFSFDYLQSVELLEFVEDTWNESNFYVHIKEIKPNDPTLSMTQIDLPFAGIDTFEIAIEKQVLDSTAVNFLVKAGTSVLSIVIFLVALGSTPYWNPFIKRMGGIGK